MKEFAEWLRLTHASVFVQSVEWIVPAVQSVHILALGVAMGAAFMICARVLGWLGPSLPAGEVAVRFQHWLLASLIVLAITGAVLIVGEPPRELLSVSFWVKMATLALALVLAMSLTHKMKMSGGDGLLFTSIDKAYAGIVLVLLVCVILLGRFIAYDNIIWGALSPESH